MLFDDAVRQKCPHCFDLPLMMGDRGKACPRATADALEATRTANNDGDLSRLSDDDKDVALSAPSVAGGSIGWSSHSRGQGTNEKHSPPTGPASASAVRK